MAIFTKTPCSYCHRDRENTATISKRLSTTNQEQATRLKMGSGLVSCEHEDFEILASLSTFTFTIPVCRLRISFWCPFLSTDAYKRTQACTHTHTHLGGEWWGWAPWCWGRGSRYEIPVSLLQSRCSLQKSSSRLRTGPEHSVPGVPTGEAPPKKKKRIRLIREFLAHAG